MSDSESNVGNAKGSWKFAVSLGAALFVMLTMVLSSFNTAVMAFEPETCQIWTAEQEYIPGEIVDLFGQGFAAGQVSISSADLSPSIGYVDADLWGHFEYTAKLVTQNELVTVEAFQDGVLKATTTFTDGPVKLEGWTLTDKGWTTGLVRGYNEDDSVPYSLTLPNPDTVLWVELAFDYHQTGSNSAYGIDYLTEYWMQDPEPPYNGYPESSQPFSLDEAGGGTITDVHYGGILPATTGEPRDLMLWDFKVNFDAGVDTVNVRWGAHLAVTTSTSYGAAWWNGASLHVKLNQTIPKTGDKDVPIATGQQSPILEPPSLELMKECTPTTVVEGDVIAFSLHFVNNGQDAAWYVNLSDFFPKLPDGSPVLSFNLGSVTKKTTGTPTVTYVNPTVDPLDSSHFWWNWTTTPIPGRGVLDVNPPYHSLDKLHCDCGDRSFRCLYKSRDFVVH